MGKPNQIILAKIDSQLFLIENIHFHLVDGLNLHFILRAIAIVNAKPIIVFLLNDPVVEKSKTVKFEINYHTFHLNFSVFRFKKTHKCSQANKRLLK